MLALANGNTGLHANPQQLDRKDHRCDGVLHRAVVRIFLRRLLQSCATLPARSTKDLTRTCSDRFLMAFLRGRSDTHASGNLGLNLQDAVKAQEDGGNQLHSAEGRSSAQLMSSL